MGKFSKKVQTTKTNFTKTLKSNFKKTSEDILDFTDDDFQSKKLTSY